jgi:D-glycero-D-manno-heptose 1,7-bisphosphate phosphatase
MKSKFLYLDRDGIINKHIPYVGTLERFYWHHEIFTIAEFFQKKGFSIKVVTNQSGIQRGYYSLVDYTKICIHMLKEFERIGIDIEIRACPHRPETNCECRKPNIGMFLDDRHEEDIMIGDQNSDMLAAKNAGIKNRWLLSENVISEYSTKKFLSHANLLEYLM